MRFWLILLTALTLSAGPGRALDLAPPESARLTNEVLRDPDSYMFPVAAYQDGALPAIEVEGRVLQQAWRIEQTGMTTLQLIRPLREQLEDAGYEIVLDCSGPECGGFDFRFGTRVMAAPDIYVDLFDFRFVSARKIGAGKDAEEDFATILVSQSGGVGYVQIIYVSSNGTSEKPQPDAKNTTPAPVANSDPPVLKLLIEQGHVVLNDLDFSTGSSTLGKGPHTSLEALASYLRADGKRRIALVGHTDRVGSLENNVALSRERAASVLENLVEEYGVRREQLESEGVGYLSPVAPNQSREGREANRRVEAVLLNTE